RVHVALKTVAVDERDGVVPREIHRQAVGTIEVVLAGDAVEEGDAMRAAAEVGGGPGVGVQVEMEASPLDIRPRAEALRANQRADAIRMLAREPHAHPRTVREGVGD